MSSSIHSVPWLSSDGAWPDDAGTALGPQGPLESTFDITFAAGLALREKQLQQNYRPIIGVHKWFARRPGTLFRNPLLAEFNGNEAPQRSFFRTHHFAGVIGDPFMGGGTPLIEANRLGFHVVGADVNPMAYWIVRQELGLLDDAAFAACAAQIAAAVDLKIRALYETSCLQCSGTATVKYFLWVKTQRCPYCQTSNDLFPGYLLAEATRHPKHVLACSDCGMLVELDVQPHAADPVACPHCGGRVQIEGPARRNKVECRGCHQTFKYPAPDAGPPQHRMWAIEYHCEQCKPGHAGRFFKAPDQADLARAEAAATLLHATEGLAIPQQAIPQGDETNRLHRWGYTHYREMFSPRQLLGLGLLQQQIEQVPDQFIRHALLTVFSDILRYQNMLCRYDTYALKCQDIFSVHGFPVGLVQCENNLLGIPGVGSGGFRHFVEKYRRAKAYCAQPFETRQSGKSKHIIPIVGERIEATFIDHFPIEGSRQAFLHSAPAATVPLAPHSLDGVFTDPPYFANVQYAELIDFCYVWLRQSLQAEFPEFTPESTRSASELTGNVTMGRDLEHFTAGLSQVFTHFAAALKPGAPFVFTYHHNEITAYAPLVVALLDAGLLCTAVLPAPAEMEASLHINNSASSILDSVFVSRREWTTIPPLPSSTAFVELLADNCRRLAAAQVRVSLGDVRCLFSGHIARLCIQQLRCEWDSTTSMAERLKLVQANLDRLAKQYRAQDLPAEITYMVAEDRPRQLQLLEERHDPPV